MGNLQPLWIKKTLYNVVPNMLQQHCIGILFSKCCPSTSFQIKTESYLTLIWVGSLAVRFEAGGEVGG